MEMNFTPFGRSMDAAGTIQPDFRALVALLAAAQAARPTAKLATRLAGGNGRRMEIAESLTAIFAPQPGKAGFEEAGYASFLAGSFNPAVPFRDGPLTNMKAW